MSLGLPTWREGQREEAGDAADDQGEAEGPPPAHLEQDQDAEGDGRHLHHTCNQVGWLVG